VNRDDLTTLCGLIKAGKVISTVAVKQNRSFSEQKLTIGLDLGDCSSWAPRADTLHLKLVKQDRDDFVMDS
jgi:hypothetical protein